MSYKLLRTARSIRLCGAILLMCVVTMPALVQGQATRTVASSEIGSIFATPNGFDWTQVGAYVGAPKSELFSYMVPAAIKVVHTRFHVFKPSDEWTWNYFPYSEFRNYEQTETAVGRAPLFLTATYQGKSRPVLWEWSLALVNGKPTADPSAWEYAVNVQDDRFIQYWINYVKTDLLAEYSSMKNIWVGVDEAAFIPGLYGVLDDNGNFVEGVTWDKPFPQNAAAYYQSIATFFTRVKQLAPTFNIMPNSGGITDWTQFVNTFGKAQGMMLEEINPEDGAYDYYVRSLQYSQLTAYGAEAAKGYPMVFASLVPTNAARIMDSTVMYMLVRGPNTFYAPEIAGTYNALPPSKYQQTIQSLGQPTGSLQCKPAGTKSASTGLCLYTRTYQHGIAYLNWTGSSQKISLPVGKYVDPHGVVISSVTLSDLRGSYVTNR
jgi:hypothetical protein